MILQISESEVRKLVEAHLKRKGVSDEQLKGLTPVIVGKFEDYEFDGYKIPDVDLPDVK